MRRGLYQASVRQRRDCPTLWEQGRWRGERGERERTGIFIARIERKGTGPSEAAPTAATNVVTIALLTACDPHLHGSSFSPVTRPQIPSHLKRAIPSATLPAATNPRLAVWLTMGSIIHTVWRLFLPAM
jgi:hypothetical protein